MDRTKPSCGDRPSSPPSQPTPAAPTKDDGYVHNRGDGGGGGGRGGGVLRLPVRISRCPSPVLSHLPAATRRLPLSPTVSRGLLLSPVVSAAGPEMHLPLSLSSPSPPHPLCRLRSMPSVSARCLHARCLQGFGHLPNDPRVHNGVSHPLPIEISSPRARLYNSTIQPSVLTPQNVSHCAPVRSAE